MHICKDGALEVYALAAENIRREWVPDPRWYSSKGGGERSRVSHLAKYPSKWQPKGTGKNGAGRPAWLSEDYKVIDYLKIT